MWKVRLKYLLVGFSFVFVFMTQTTLGASPSTEYVVLYSNEFTLFLCIIVWLLSSWLGMKLPPDNDDVDLEPSVKFVTSLLGGLLAFIYCLYRDQSLTLLNPVWIAVASIILPVTILNLRIKFKEYSKSISFTKKDD